MRHRGIGDIRMKSTSSTRRTGGARTIALAMAAATATLIAAAPASAASITYINTQQIGTVLAKYSITTDGTIGGLTGANITAFDVTLSDNLTTTEFGKSTTSSSGTASGRFIATATSLSMYAYNSALDFNTTARGSTGVYLAGFEIGGSQSSVYFSDAAHNGSYYQSAAEPNNVAFATMAIPSSGDPAVSAVPEPAVWAMMMIGLGAIGVALRRRQKVTTRVAYAA